MSKSRLKYQKFSAWKNDNKKKHFFIGGNRTGSSRFINDIARIVLIENGFKEEEAEECLKTVFKNVSIDEFLEK